MRFLFSNQKIVLFRTETNYFFGCFITLSNPNNCCHKKIRSVIITACASIFVEYIISWVLSFFGIKSFIWGASWLAIGFNVIAAIFATMALLLDFDFIERYKNRASKDKEWLATWGLLVTIIWLYVELLRLMRKFAIRF